MSYHVLARKWRPANFNELVGQRQTSQALINALESQRLHHAYLFTGTRGVGKTTIARILAKSLNCEKGITSQPCGECSSCVEISQGNFVDLLEIDAASKTKVEDTRELLDNVQYRPTRGRYKVYLIDEVHMLSGHSFNALLKTLEEPPPHVIFLLATTDPQKMPVTVLSRCLQFHLRRMEEPEIVNHLSMILKSEDIRFEEGALEPIAKGADGSMRDALSLLDQAIAFCGEQLDKKTVLDMLGTIDRAYAVKLLNAIKSNDVTALMAAIDEISEYAPDYDELLADWLSLLHQIAVVQATGVSDDSQINAMAQEVTPADLQLFYQLSLHARRDLPFASHPRQGFEMAMLRILAFKPQTKPTLPGDNKKKINQTELSSSPNTVRKVERPQPQQPSVDRPTVASVENNGIDQHAISNNLQPSTEAGKNSFESNNESVARKIWQQTEADSGVAEKEGESSPPLRVIVNNTSNTADISNNDLGNVGDKNTLNGRSEDLSSNKNKVSNEASNTDISQAGVVQSIDSGSLSNQLLEASGEPPGHQPKSELEKPETMAERAARKNLEWLSLEKVNAANWYNVVEALTLEGNGLQVLLNSIAENQQGKLVVNYLSKMEPLLTSNALKLIQAQLKEYFANQQLIIELNTVSETSENPRERQTRLRELAIDEAQQKLLSDPQISYLMDTLGATLPRESISLKS
ncbi:DNA polymerase III subunit gamma/tau [Aliikangiella coralliicola]|uniref:DNA polymerase III subunit gamma/tau n=1 Tax=Aliikangiella coralliicola TaxID=2592383 RepID=A0A545UD34_9GAMM|nr:DNA polymerase III subunit gamma/tau [Aliikangiella coralliicola]TQV87372.1 DNA polymerase III subunit gamma/tau [Aliikangiella coralliicola]